jgi:hypothetical protein
MDDRDDELKMYLRTFQLRAPAPLPVATRAPRVSAWLAVAAVLALAVVVSLTVKSNRPGEKPRLVERQPLHLTAGALTRLTDGDVVALDEVLSVAAPHVLPDVERQTGLFHRIAAP